MKIRRLQYNIDYVHIITFREEYKQAIAPYFVFDNLRYGIDNENTINESVRLIFEADNFGLFARKEGLTFLFEGDIDNLMNQNGIIKLFWDLYERIKALKGYKKTSRHSIIIHAVEIHDKTEVETILQTSPYFKINPFGNLNEFSCIYEFEKSDKKYKFEFGNYSEKDIKNHNLTQFDTEFNKDLIGNVGLICRLEITEVCKTPSFSKFTSLISTAEKAISSYKLD